ncbi:MAG TPA: hypothetical protein DEE98_06150 [Elusimicrobia bacterium]|nr:MAG: hypothetical protein A2278_02055 [Elusimicrobia bacterium RIFOXYA12_FULL_49_49]OGS09795.1 MAG: hypothetical protein A2204_04680 [Elusimicrobia bacterium RIFOXYA1_FULL_47_7]OGS10813.1 MAG: hypothetical protein A2386_06710 [Elusimicrobia bacterium RIFOXYB1_FULL_48_9]OGS16830.1 MAG: hypothetical protein A2251_05505 [Elusimicrobia bacterium RIFOXYA2_FULL_47_53]OGS32058.1 MAG: hypothetical protein A2323_08280 [Elusimicrobia bacterium RIFOXYB2_FULL_46_23]HBU69951.1 hypothetical protein [Elus
MFSEEQELTIEDVIRVFVKRWKLIFLPVILVAFTAFVYNMYPPKVYKSVSLLKIGLDGNRYLEPVYSLDKVMHSTPQLIEVAKLLKINMDSDTLKTLASSVEFKDLNGYVEIIVTDDNPQYAFMIADAFTKVLYRRHQVLYLNAKSNMKSLIIDVKELLRPIPLSSGVSELRVVPTTVEVPAIINDKPVEIKRKPIVMTMSLIALLITTILAFYIERKNIKTEGK